MRSRDVIKVLEAEGWYIIRIKGSHHDFAHHQRRGIVTVPHPSADLAIGTLSRSNDRAALNYVDFSRLYTYIHIMALAHYTAVVERSATGFSVFFPDVPGCVSAGRNEREAFENAEEALAFHLTEMAAAGEPIPDPSLDILTDPEVEEYCRFLARVELPGRAIRLNITMDEGLVAAIDKVASNRSSFLADAARDALAKRRARVVA